MSGAARITTVYDREHPTNRYYGLMYLPIKPLEHQAVVVGGVLGILAVRVDLRLEAFVKPFPSKLAPAGSFWMVGEGQPGSEQTGGFRQQVVVLL